jgi:hypothetical protein
MRASVAVKAIPKGAARMPLKMLEMGGHAIIAGFVGAHSSTTLATSLTARRGKFKTLFNLDRHPTFPPKFAIYRVWHCASQALWTESTTAGFPTVCASHRSAAHQRAHGHSPAAASTGPRIHRLHEKWRLQHEEAMGQLGQARDAGSTAIDDDGSRHRCLRIAGAHNVVSGALAAA